MISGTEQSAKKRLRLPSLRIATKVTLLLSAIAVLASATVGVITYTQFSRALVSQELKQLSSLADIKAVRLTAELDALRTDAKFVSRSPVMQRLVRARQSGGIDPVSHEVQQQLVSRASLFCRELMQAKPAYFQVRLIGVADGGREIVRVDREAKGGAIRVVPHDELQQKGEEHYFREAIGLGEGEVYVSDVNLNREHGRVAEPLTPVIRAATPIYGSDGKAVAILVINRFFEPLADALRAGMPDDLALLVTNERGDYLIHPEAKMIFGFDLRTPHRIQDDYPALLRLVATPAHPTTSIVDRSSGGERVAIGVRRVPIDPRHPDRFLEVAVAAPYDSATAVSARSRNHSLLAGGLVMSVALVSGYFLSRSVTEPLRKIATAAKAFGRGETPCELPTGSRDEIGVVARSLADMMSDIQSAHADLKRRAEQLEESRRSALNILQDVDASRQKTEQAEHRARDQAARTQAILEGATDAIITINADGIVESFNDAAVRMFQYAADAVIGRNVKVLMPSPYHEEHDGYLHNYLTTGVSKIIGIGREVVGLRADGTTFPMHLAISDVKLGDRRLFTGIVRDITDLKQTMQQLTAANAELARRSEQIEQFNLCLSRSNEELRQFAYVASHDLQEPLRKITAFCQMLRDDYGDRLDDDARTYIQYAVDGALRMRTLIQDLLAFSRVETQGRPLEPTDAGAACNEAIENLALSIDDAAAEVTRDPLPMVLADRAQLVRLFQNLIGNALKYRGSDLPRIHVSAEENGDEWVFRVRDNGIGIDPQYYERIFVIFQRLHAREEYSGTGIGLAVCKRIVERAGGRIWVESQPGEGSVFCFTLAKPCQEASTSSPGNDHDRIDSPVEIAAH